MKTMKHILQFTNLFVLALMMQAIPALAADPICGDGALDKGEECDDGNQVDTDSCDNSCIILDHKLEANNPSIDFATLVSKQEFELKAPAEIMADPSCTCIWSADPAVIEFAPTDTCTTTMAVGDVGEGRINLDVKCESDLSGSFLQEFKNFAIEPDQNADNGGCALARTTTQRSSMLGGLLLTILCSLGIYRKAQHS